MTVFTNLAGLGLFSTWQNLEITLTFGHFLCLPEIIVFLIYCKKIDAYARQDLNLVLCRVGVWIVSLDAPFDIIIFCNNFERKTRTQFLKLGCHDSIRTDVTRCRQKNEDSHFALDSYQQQLA